MGVAESGQSKPVCVAMGFFAGLGDGDREAPAVDAAVPLASDETSLRPHTKRQFVTAAEFVASVGRQWFDGAVGGHREQRRRGQYGIVGLANSRTQISWARASRCAVSGEVVCFPPNNNNKM